MTDPAELDLECPNCKHGLTEKPSCGMTHATLALEIADAPKLYAYALGAVAEKNRLERELEGLRAERPAISVDSDRTYEVQWGDSQLPTFAEVRDLVDQSFKKNPQPTYEFGNTFHKMMEEYAEYDPDGMKRAAKFSGNVISREDVEKFDIPPEPDASSTLPPLDPGL